MTDRPILQTKKPPFWTANKIQALKDFNEEGMSAAQIGRILGCSRNACIGKLNRIKVPLKNGKTQDMKRQTRRYARNPTTYTRAATEIAPMPDEPVSLEVPFRAVGERACKWIAGQPSADATMCWHPTASDEPYCQFHRLRAYAPLKPYHRLEALDRAVR